MKRSEVWGFIFLPFSALMCAVLLANFVNAAVIYYGDSIGSQYARGDRITGILNISLDNVNMESVVKTNFGQEIMLKNFLDANNFVLNSNYNCSSYNCLPRYVRGEAITSMNFSGNELIGFSVQGGDIESIQDLRLSILGSSTASCFPEIVLDVLDKNKTFVGSSRYILDSSCNEVRYGCFEIGRNDYQLATISTNIEYCEKIALPPAPAFRLGAKVVNSTQGLALLKMRLYDMNVSFLGECNLPNTTELVQSVACTLPYSSTAQKDYLVCIKAAGQSNYKIKIETNSPCGTTDFGNNYAADYEIFAKNLKFDVPRIDLSTSSFVNFTGENLNEYVSSFINDNYDNSCNPYCSVPFGIIGGAQLLNFNDAYISYRSSAGQLESSSVYSLDKEGSEVSSGQLRFNLALANFTIPENAAEEKITIDIGGERIVDKPINLSAGFSFDLQPKFAAFGIETEFSLITDENNITQVRWNFGDSTQIQTSSGNKARHRYTSQGQYNIEVQAGGAGGAQSTKRFDIIVGDPKTSANSTLMDYQRKLETLDANLTSLPAWLREPIKEILKYNEINQSIRESELDYSFASNDSQYISIINRLVELEVPSGIITELNGSVPIGAVIENADVSLIEEISNSDIENDESLRESIAEFMDENYDSTVKFERLGAYYGNNVETLVTKFKINAKPKTARQGDYLILGYPKEQVVLSQDYNAQGLDSATYFALENNEIFEFAVLDAVSAEELGAYISSAVQDLDINQESCNLDGECDSGEDENCADCRSGSSKWIWITLVVVILGAGIFLLVKKYSKGSSAFKNAGDLKNIISFINNARGRGMPDSAIIDRLDAVGWSSRQIKYAFSVIKKERKVY